MIIISLTKEVEQKHWEYCEANILPGIKEANSFSVNSDYLKSAPGFDTSAFHEEAKNFWDYIIVNFKDISIGKPEKLKILNNEIKNKFAMVHENIQNLDLKNENSQTYKQYLLDLFCYDKFKTKDVYELLLNSAKKRLNKSRYCPEIREVLLDDIMDLIPDKSDMIFRSFFENGTMKQLNSIEFKTLFKDLEIDLTMHNFNVILTSVDVWSDYVFVMESGVRVCPYCNRQYITPVYSDLGKLRGEIDHFLPKSVYPYFSMSLYNMIPVCHTCNHKKGAKDFDFESINPYQESLNDHFTFEVNPLSHDLCIKMGEAKKEAIKKHVDTFKLKPLYSYHNNQAIELLKKRQMYPDAYIRELFSKYEAYFSSIEDLKEFIIGYISDENQLNNEAFLKLRRDIAKQLNFLIEPAEDEQIIKLKEIAEKM
jgi:hypothetical protein